MRPVNKGTSPYSEINHYTEALPYLERAIGSFCSYCGFPISHVPEVEHISAKSRGGAITNWENLLLGCKYCNSRKGAKVTPEKVNDYLWPDKDNTAVAFSYEGGIPKVNDRKLNKIDPTGTRRIKANNLFELVGLGNIPTPKERDARFHQRNKAYELALEALCDWQEAKKSSREGIDLLKRQIVRNAQGHGFFSVWMTVFSDEPDILEALIEGFPGTNRDCYDDDYHPKCI